MSRKTAILLLIISTLMSTTFSADISGATDVETNGNLKVNGVIESSSGGFMFPDGSTLTTVGVTGTPLAHGVTGSNGNWTGNSHSANVFAVSRTSTGVYEITITGEFMSFANHTAVISMADSGPGFTSYTYNGSGHLVVTTYGTSGVAADRAFAYIIMKK